MQSMPSTGLVMRKEVHKHLVSSMPGRPMLKVATGLDLVL